MAGGRAVGDALEGAADVAVVPVQERRLGEQPESGEKADQRRGARVWEPASAD